MPFALLLVLAAGPVKVASPAWNVVDIKPELASFYAEQMAQALRAEGLTVTTSDDIATLLGAERQKELLGCASTTTSCMAELANALGCDATLTVNLARLGSSFRGLAKLMSSLDGSIISSVKIEANSEAQLSDRIEGAAKELAKPYRAKGTTPSNAKVEAKPQPVVETSTRVAPPLWWVPGAVGIVAGGISALLLGLSYEKFTTLVNHDGTTADGIAWRDDGKALQGSGIALAAGGGAAIITSVIWLIAGSKDVQPQVAITPHGASLGIAGSF
ncbi:MAG: hypothetical protein QM817_23820 [Archangium sp.]